MSTRSEIDKFGFNLMCNLELEGGGSTITYLHSFTWFHDANFIRGGSRPYPAALPDRPAAHRPPLPCRSLLPCSPNQLAPIGPSSGPLVLATRGPGPGQAEYIQIIHPVLDVAIVPTVLNGVIGTM